MKAGKIRIPESGIYQIKNKSNGKVYVGSSINIKTRWSSHKYQLKNGKHKNQHLQSAWNKYGGCSFVFEVLESTSAEKEILLEREQYWMDLKKAYEQKTGYNISKNSSHPPEQFGVTPPNAKLNHEKASQIRASYIGDRFLTYADLADDYGVSPRAIELVVNNISFKSDSDTLSEQEIHKIKRTRRSKRLKESAPHFNEEIVREIRKKYKRCSISELAAKYGVSSRYVKGIVENVTWVDPEYTPIRKSKEEISGLIRKASLGKKHSEGRKLKMIKAKRKNSFLTQELVNKIRTEYESSTATEIADKYGITVGSVKNVITNRRWYDENYTPISKYKTK